MAFSTKRFSDFTKRDKSQLLLSSYFVGYQDNGLKSEIRVPIIDLLNNVYNQTQTIVYTNSSSWDKTATSYRANSANFVSTYLTVNTLSAGWGGGNSTNWNNTYTTVRTNSAEWGNASTILETYSGSWNDTTDTLNSQSATWDNTSLLFNNYSPLWNDVYTITQTYSSGWEQTKSTVASNSALWAANGTNVTQLSGNWQNTYTILNTNSGKWQSTYSSVYANSANWNNSTVINYTHANFLPLTGGTISGNLTAGTLHVDNGLTVGTGARVLYVDSAGIGVNTSSPNQALTVVGNISSSSIIYASGGNSNNWNSVYTTFRDVSSTFITSQQTLIYNDATRDLSISSGNTISLSSINRDDFNSIKALSGSWNNTYTTVAGNSAGWGYQGTDIKALTSNWQDTYTVTKTYSGEWDNVYTTTRDNSASWSDGVIVISNLSGNWEDTYSTVLANSASWAIDKTADSGVRALTGNWQNTYTILNANSGKWNSNYTTVNTLSSNWSNAYTTVRDGSANWGYRGTDIKALTSNWQDAFTNVQSNSSNWQETYTLFSQQSAGNLAVQSAVTVNSAAWIDTNTTVWVNSGLWGSAVDTTRYEATYTTVRQLSANWELTRQTVSDGSKTWGDTYSTVITNSANWESAYLNQGNYLPLAGGTMTGDVLFQQNVTIYGNLSCSGTQTFANTIFTTTSALSVVHIGAGPAMWVGNNGTGDIASFYDIDQNIEILHVGGQNSIYPNIGILTSEPNKELTVNGEISASGNITAEELLLNGARLQTLTTQATANGEFLIMNINGVDRALRLWDF